MRHVGTQRVVRVSASPADFRNADSQALVYRYRIGVSILARQVEEALMFMILVCVVFEKFREQGDKSKMLLLLLCLLRILLLKRMAFYR